MNRHNRVCIGVVATVALVAPALGDEPVPQQVIVTLVPGHTIEEVLADYTEYGPIEVIGAIDSAQTYLLLTPEDQDESEIEDLLEKDVRIDEAESNEEFQSVEGQTQSFYLNVLPGDFSEQPAFEIIELAEVAGTIAGSGVTVALLDTGIDSSHELLAGRIAAGGWNFISGTDDVSDVGTGIDQDGDGAIDEMVGHGTFMAGLIAGIAPSASILPVKVLNGDGRGDLFTVAQGIYHAVDSGADVINLSLAVEDGEDFLVASIEHAVAAGVPVIVAAGNLGSGAEMYLVESAETISVAGTDEVDVKCQFSNFAEHIKLSAPACSVVSTVPGNGYAEWEGTSMSAAMTAATVALLLSAAPELTPGQVEDVLESSAAGIDAANPEYAGLLGSGRLDIAAALAMVVPTMPSPDLNGDGLVDVVDVTLLIGAWGAGDSPFDLDESGTVDVGDLVILISHWN